MNSATDTPGLIQLRSRHSVSATIERLEALAVPAAGLDLPLKMLAWEAPDGEVWAAYNDPQYLVQRYGLPAALAATLAAVVPLIERAVAE